MRVNKVKCFVSVPVDAVFFVKVPIYNHT